MSITRFLAAAILVAAFVPLAAYADSDVLLTNDGGTFTSNTQGTGGTVGVTTLSLTGSYLVGIQGLSNLGIANESELFNSTGCPPCYGSVTLQTGTLTSGVLNETGTFSSTVPIATFGGNGNFMVTGPNGMVFSGTFTSASWFKTAPGTFVFQGTLTNVTLVIEGFTYNISGAVTIDLTTNGQGVITNPNGTVSFLNDAGQTNFISPVPEPGALTLLGTGLIAIGFMVRKALTSA